MNGAQAERTSLAWSRTVAPLICLVAYQLRIVNGTTALVALVVAGALTAWALRTRRRSRYQRDHYAVLNGTRPADPRRTGLLAGAVLLTGAVLAWEMMSP